MRIIGLACMLVNMTLCGHACGAVIATTMNSAGMLTDDGRSIHFFSNSLVTYAQPFKVPDGTDSLLDSFELGLMTVDRDNPFLVRFSLVDDGTGGPGSTSEDLGTLLIEPPNFKPRLYSVDPNGRPVLRGGSTYWLLAEPGDRSGSLDSMQGEVYWLLGTENVLPPLQRGTLVRNGGLGDYLWTTLPGDNVLSLRVHATAVPEVCSVSPLVVMWLISRLRLWRRSAEVCCS